MFQKQIKKSQKEAVEKIPDLRHCLLNVAHRTATYISYIIDIVVL